MPLQMVHLGVVSMSVVQFQDLSNSKRDSAMMTWNILSSGGIKGIVAGRKQCPILPAVQRLLPNAIVECKHVLSPCFPSRYTDTRATQLTPGGLQSELHRKRISRD